MNLGFTVCEQVILRKHVNQSFENHLHNPFPRRSFPAVLRLFHYAASFFVSATSTHSNPFSLYRKQLKHHLEGIKTQLSLTYANNYNKRESLKPVVDSWYS